MRRASSRPETTSRSSPVSSRTRRTMSGPFRASRTALVATARTSAPSRRQSAAYRRSVESSRSATGRGIEPVANTPSPGRIGSRSWCRVSSEPSGSGRASSSRTALVPTSMAARTTRSLGLVRTLPPPGQTRHSVRRAPVDNHVISPHFAPRPGGVRHDDVTQAPGEPDSLRLQSSLPPTGVQHGAARPYSAPRRPRGARASPGPAGPGCAAPGCAAPGCASPGPTGPGRAGPGCAGRRSHSRRAGPEALHQSRAVLAGVQPARAGRGR